MVGRAASILVSSATFPFSIGTLKSTRMNTRFPARSRSVMESLVIYFVLVIHSAPDIRRLPAVRNELDQIDDPAGVAPLIVIPGQQLDELTVHYVRVFSIQNRGVRVASEISRYQRLIGIGENAPQRAVGRFLHRGVDGLFSLFFLDAAYEIDD